MKKTNAFAAAAAIVATLSIALYAVGNEEITALMNREITISFGGEKQQMLNEIGETVYPISYEGTTYLPVRAICNLFDIDITWDQENNLVAIAAPTKDDGISVELGDFKLTVFEDGTVRLDRYCGVSENVVIPDGVTFIGKSAFDGVILERDGGKIPSSVYIPDSVERIEEMAFFDLEDSTHGGLTEVRMSSGIREIGINAFAECHQLKKVTLDSELTQEVVVEDGAFAYCEALESCDLVGSENVEFKNDVFIGTPLQG